jgi:predicted nucleic acid-binding Zn ribbon protein
MYKCQICGKSLLVDLGYCSYECKMALETREIVAARNREKRIAEYRRSFIGVWHQPYEESDDYHVRMDRINAMSGGHPDDHGSR